MILIDVRTKKEYNESHILDALLHDVTEMMQGVFPDIDKSEEITVYCRSGGRSSMAKTLMEKAGFKKIKNGGSIDNLS